MSDFGDKKICSQWFNGFMSSVVLLKHSFTVLLWLCMFTLVLFSLLPSTANSEYYNLLMSSGAKERRDATVCTLEELEGITSEHTLKNTVRGMGLIPRIKCRARMHKCMNVNVGNDPVFQDTFVVVFSLGTGKVVYASEQASSVLHCKRKFLESAKFVELLYHQDVNVFYSHTAQPRLPPWNVGTDSGESAHGCSR